MGRQDDRDHAAELQRVRDLEKAAAFKQGRVQPKDIVLWCLAGVTAVALYMTPGKTHLWAFLGPLCMAVLAVHPATHLPWVIRARSKKERRVRSITAVLAVVLPVSFYGWFVWTLPYRYALHLPELPALGQEQEKIVDLKSATVRKKSPFPESAPIYPMYVANPQFDAQSPNALANDSTVTSEQLFAQLREALIVSLADGPEKSNALTRLGMLERAKGYTFLRHYSSFITGAADHMTVVSPFIPGLTSILVRV
jgi:hypothetical protein